MIVMTSWRYFFTTPQDRGADSIIRNLGRTDEDGPRHNAQMLNGEAEWAPSEFLERYHLLGSTDKDYVFVPETRAREIIDGWLSEGKLPHAPTEP